MVENNMSLPFLQIFLVCLPLLNQFQSCCEPSWRIKWSFLINPVYSALNKFSERKGETFTMFSEGVEVPLFSIQDGNDFLKRKNHTELMDFDPYPSFTIYACGTFLVP